MSNRAKILRLFFISFFYIAFTVSVFGETEKAASINADSIQWDAGLNANIGNGSFAPYYIAALTHGTVIQSKGLLLHAAIGHDLNFDKRFSWGAKAELYGGATSNTEYLKWKEGTTYLHNIRPSAVWLQQLYGELKYRSLFLEIGMKQHASALLDNSLTSGDLVESGNARPIPEVRVGFIDFQNIPFTKGWVQIQGELAYGKFMDNGWMEDFYSYGTDHINTGAYYLYRRLYLRTKPSERFSVTVGMQAAGQIGGWTQYWRRGYLVKQEDNSVSFLKLLTSIIPGNEGSAEGAYYGGNNLGSWDIFARYNLPDDKGTLHAYLQKPWEKASSIGFMNGWDGLWGIEYVLNGRCGFLEAVLFEYLYFLNQSGPIHYALHDSPGTTIQYESQGRDNYYNNYEYNSYANYGIGIGTPFLKAPRYNTDGYPQYTHNLVKGFHIAAKGKISTAWKWKAALSYREAFGTGWVPSPTKYTDFSWLIETEGHLRSIPRLQFKAQIAGDHGNYLGNNFGILIGATYRGAFSIGK